MRHRVRAARGPPLVEEEALGDAQLKPPVGGGLDVEEGLVESYVSEYGLLHAQRQVVVAPLHLDGRELGLEPFAEGLEPGAETLVTF